MVAKDFFLLARVFRAGAQRGHAGFGPDVTQQAAMYERMAAECDDIGAELADAEHRAGKEH